MTAVGDLLGHLSGLGCRAELTETSVKVLGPVDRVPTSLMAEARRAKVAIRYELLREQAEALVAFIDGDAPLAERQARLSELVIVEDRLSAAQEQLWASWRRAGFTILWSALVEELILVGDSSPPPGSEGMALYTWTEVQALKDATPERVLSAQKLKKAFAGMVRCAGKR